MWLKGQLHKMTPTRQALCREALTVGVSIIHPSFTVLTFYGKRPGRPDKECEYLLHNYI